MPEGLTQTKTPTFSETRPEIDRNGGRVHFGMGGRFQSERWAAFKSQNPAGINRNPQFGVGPAILSAMTPWARSGMRQPTGEFRRITESLSNVKVCRTIERQSNNLLSLDQARVSLFELEHHFDECFYSAFRPGFAITIQEDRPLARIKIVGADLNLIIGCLLVADAFGTEPFERKTHLWAVLARAHADLLH